MALNDIVTILDVTDNQIDGIIGELDWELQIF
jgi:hypothetical protein